MRSALVVAVVVLSISCVPKATDLADPGDGGSDAGQDAGPQGAPCTWSAASNPCGAGKYCAAPGCGPGTCERMSPAGEVGSAKDPRCGCDGRTYWNAQTLASHGVAEKSAGACAELTSCGGFTGRPCPDGMKCRYQVASKSDCSVSDHSGECWFLPATCARATGNPGARDCSGSACSDECSVSNTQSTWFSDSSCPG